MAATSQTDFGNVVPFPRRFRTAAGAAAAADGGRRAVGNAALFAVAILIVVSGSFLLQGLASIPRHVDCNFSKHRPCHSFLPGN